VAAAPAPAPAQPASPPSPPSPPSSTPTASDALRYAQEARSESNPNATRSSRRLLNKQVAVSRFPGLRPLFFSSSPRAPPPEKRRKKLWLEPVHASPHIYHVHNFLTEPELRHLEERVVYTPQQPKQKGGEQEEGGFSEALFSEGQAGAGRRGAGAGWVRARAPQGGANCG
jgi:hypothetical protein